MAADRILTRRQALVSGVAATGAVLFARRLDPAPRWAYAQPLVPPIREREGWAAGLAPTGPLEAEPDVRFLLVHHSASGNEYGPEAVGEEIRSFYRLHIAKGWPDVAYNFFVDRFGGLWEGRQGSLAGSVKGDATGGSQGFALLCCFIGDHRTSAPTPEAQAAMVDLLAWLAGRHGIDPRSTVSFVSRGSNRWPAGASVTTAAIAGHRDMSRTACPGDAAYALVRGPFPERVAARLGLTGVPAPAPAPAPEAEPAPPPLSSTSLVAPNSSTSTSTIASPTTKLTSEATQPPIARPAQATRSVQPTDGGDPGNERLLALGTAGALMAAALVWFRRRPEH